VAVLALLGEAHGYGIMGELKVRIGGGWKPSPGAIYPALLALVDSGHVETVERDGVRVYSLTGTGRQRAAAMPSTGRWASLTARAETQEERLAIGALLDRFATRSRLRRRLAGEGHVRRIDALLAEVEDEIEQLLAEGENDG